MAEHTTSARIEHALWPALLIAVSAVSTLGFACVTPFAAFTVAAALVLPIRSALFSVAGVWLANQAIGFAFLGYPWAVDTMLWGVAIGASALMTTVLAASVLRLGAAWNLAVALALALVAAVLAFEPGVFLVTFALGRGGRVHARHYRPVRAAEPRLGGRSGWNAHHIPSFRLD